MPMPLVQRKAILADLVAATNDEHLQFTGDFEDSIKLLDTCQRMNLEGIASKRREFGIPPGPNARLAED